MIFMFTDRLRAYAEEVYTKTLPSLGRLGDSITERIEEMFPEHQVIMKLLYGTLPLSDLAEVSFDTLKDYAVHAHFMRWAYSHVAELPESIFLHYVLYPRVGTEKLVDCRSFFHKQLRDILKLPKEQWILAVNRWCAAHMTYAAADDRTENPMTAYSSGTGRCGEESVFTVTALRSIGIPARQVYAPWWSHCDDNHAWVEVWTDGAWHFLGACEPEPVLDRGWFISASSRAMVVHSRTFFDFTDEATADEAFIGHDGICRMYNQTPRYAKTGTLRVRVEDEEGKPRAGETVSFQVVNMAGLRTIAEVMTDSSGVAELTAGGGTVWAEVSAMAGYGKLVLQAKPGAVTAGTLVLHPGAPADGEHFVEFYAPTPSDQNARPLTPEQQREKRETLAAAKEVYDARIASLRSPVPENDPCPEKLRAILELAGGNGGALWRFYRKTPEEEKPMALDLLESLSKKDYKDVPVTLLRRYLHHGLTLEIDRDEGFVPYVMCPRIEYEELTGDPLSLCRAFECQQERFQSDPPSCMAYIQENYVRRHPRFHRELSMTPMTSLRLGYCDARGGEILFVAIMRALGTPARLDPLTGKAQYWHEGSFRYAHGDAPDAKITLERQPGVNWIPDGNFSLARWEEGGCPRHERVENFETQQPPCLPLWGRWHGESRDGEGNSVVSSDSGGYCRTFCPLSHGSAMTALPKGEPRTVRESVTLGGFVPLHLQLQDSTLSLAAGKYRLITTNRLPNGNQKVSITDFTLRRGEEKTVPLTMADARPEEMLAENPLPPFTLQDAHGRELPTTGKRLLAWLDIGTEPTEHILNELLESREKLAEMALPVILVLEKETENGTLRQVLKKVPQARVACGDFGETAETLARAMYLEPGQWPLVILDDGKGLGRYGHCGYGVGIVELALKLSALPTCGRQ